MRIFIENHTAEVLVSLIALTFSTVLIVLYHAFLFSLFQSMGNWVAQACLVLVVLACIRLLYLLMSRIIRAAEGIIFLTTTSLRASIDSIG